MCRPGARRRRLWGPRSVTWFRVQCTRGQRPGGRCRRFLSVQGLGLKSDRRLGPVGSPLGMTLGAVLGCGVRGLWVSAHRRAGKSGGPGVGVRRAPMGPWPERGVNWGAWGRTAWSWGQDAGAWAHWSHVVWAPAGSRPGSERRARMRPAGARAVSDRVGDVCVPAFVLRRCSLALWVLTRWTFPFRAIIKRRYLPHVASLDVFGCQPRSGSVEGLGPDG